MLTLGLYYFITVISPFATQSLITIERSLCLNITLIKRS